MGFHADSCTIMIIKFVTSPCELPWRSQLERSASNREDPGSKPGHDDFPGASFSSVNFLSSDFAKNPARVVNSNPGHDDFPRKVLFSAFE